MATVLPRSTTPRGADPHDAAREVHASRISATGIVAGTRRAVPALRSRVGEPLALSRDGRVD